jgi:hypothetical protein
MLIFSHWPVVSPPKILTFLLNHSVVVLAGCETVLLSAAGCLSRRVAWTKLNSFLEQLTFVMWVWRNKIHPYYQSSLGGCVPIYNSFYGVALLSNWPSAEVLARWDRGIESYSRTRNWTPASFLHFVGYFAMGTQPVERVRCTVRSHWRSIECTEAFFTLKTSFGFTVHG